ncbi:4775_t:CDS:2 [Cetraspora pellucida]|uniref:4775_t:CDS:1 n=1 Tax=Cetraspora pellucida TaxID=1433469 RepID=A0ACA9M7P3_9GLOM|nr:4775_t:CDS:2 [Cetraspora pellucida]
MDTDIDDLYDTDIPTSKSQDVLQLFNDNVTTSTTTMSNSNIASNIPVTSLTPIISKKNFKPKSSVSPYFSQKTIDNKMLVTFTPEMTISNQILILTQKTKLHMLVAEWIVSDTLPFLIVLSESFATMLQYPNANIEFSSYNEWKPNKILLDICILPHSHTGEKIDTRLHSVFAAFNITNKILSESNLLQLCAHANELSTMLPDWKARKDVKKALYLAVPKNNTDEAIVVASSHVSQFQSDQIQYSNISSTIWAHFKEVFDRERSARNLTFDEMCNRIEVCIQDLGDKIKTTTTKNFYNNNTSCKSSILNDIGRWLDNME